METKTAKRLTQVLEASKELTFHEASRIVLISDCHRGNGTWADNFLNNQNLYYAALSYYYQNDFTYIELGDGDELWENRRLDRIIAVHSDIYKLLSQFHTKGRLHLLFGNHDIVKKNPDYVKEHCASCSIKKTGGVSTMTEPLKLPAFRFSEGLILRSRETNKTIFLVHGHQGEWLNDTCWKLARFLVRYIWRPLELIGVHDPTSAARNYRKKDKMERKIADWAQKNKQMTVCGHTHRPVFPKPGKGYYFNDGSCLHPRSITALEIKDGSISLVKWTVKTREDLSLYVGREVLAGPTPLSDYLGES